jgi:molybdenum cofactor biosynthesis enzyme
MEALTSHDLCMAVDRALVIRAVRLVKKTKKAL